MTTKHIFLSFPLYSDAPSPPAIPTVATSPFLTVDDDGANVTMLKLTTHTGTHLDTPRHVFNEGKSITVLDAEDFVFSSPVVIDLPLEDTVVVQPSHLTPFVERGKDADFLLFRFGYAEVRQNDKTRYSTKCPGFGIESATFLRDNFPTMRGLGMDVPSLSCIEYLDETMEAHHALLGGQGRTFIVVEDMDLDHDLGGLKQVIVAPLRVDDADGGPCTIIGIVE